MNVEELANDLDTITTRRFAQQLAEKRLEEDRPIDLSRSNVESISMAAMDELVVHEIEQDLDLIFDDPVEDVKRMYDLVRSRHE